MRARYHRLLAARGVRTSLGLQNKRPRSSTRGRAPPRGSRSCAKRKDAHGRRMLPAGDHFVDGAGDSKRRVRVADAALRLTLQNLCAPSPRLPRPRNRGGGHPQSLAGLSFGRAQGDSCVYRGREGGPAPRISAKERRKFVQVLQCLWQ